MLFGKIVQTIVGGAVGMAALLFVAKVSYDAGHDVGVEECRYKRLLEERKAIEAEGSRKDDISNVSKTESGERDESKPVVQKAPGKLGTMFGLKNLIGGRKTSVIKDLRNFPEEHKIEAFVEDDELIVKIRKRD